MQGFRGQKDSAVEGVREAAVAATDHHGDDDEFGDDGKFAGEGGVDIWVAEGEADGAIGGNDFEEAGEEGKGVVVGVLHSRTLGDGDDEEA